MELPVLKDLPHLTYTDGDLSIELNILGNREYTKISYPVKYGVFSRLETRDFIMEFTLNHEIRHARGKTENWLHPQEWLKRTRGNDWIYYSTGGYAGVFESIGEYYLPNLMYTTNSLLGGRPFAEPEVIRLSENWHRTLAGVDFNRPDMPGPVREWVDKILAKTPADLEKKASALFDICGERTTVLPPDARHSDYDVIPLTLSDGCLYKCRFCKVKNKKAFAPRSKENIRGQLQALRDLYGDDLINYNSLFLGEHDALNAPDDLILFAAQTAYDTLEFGRGIMTRPALYFFGSVDAVLNAPDDLFKELSALPFSTCINIGLESADPETLEKIGKPVTAEKVTMAFHRMQEINKTCQKVEMTCNFIMDEGLPAGHTTAMMALVRDSLRFTQPKGSVYLSPLRFGRPSREVLFDFYHLKTRSRLPMFLYIIQRL
ncbi:MAG TPA: radical SAM domain-containing protein [Desulfobacteraceae bacterium]|nr:radical SAM domain-containing protein [Desulfobacteraceae bacterium]